SGVEWRRNRVQPSVSGLKGGHRRGTEIRRVRGSDPGSPHLFPVGVVEPRGWPRSLADRVTADLWVPIPSCELNASTPLLRSRGMWSMIGNMARRRGTVLGLAMVVWVGLAALMATNLGAEAV